MYYPQIYELFSGGETILVRRTFANVSTSLCRGITVLFHPRASNWTKYDPGKTYTWRVRLEVTQDAHGEAPLFILDLGENCGELSGGATFREQCGYVLRVSYRDIVTQYSTDLAVEFIPNQIVVLSGEINIYIESENTRNAHHRIATIIAKSYAEGISAELGNHFIQLDEAMYDTD